MPKGFPGDVHGFSAEAIALLDDVCLAAIPAREPLIPKNVQGISPYVRLRKKKPFSLAHLGCIPSPETLLAGDSQRLLARADFFWFERNLGSDDGADWFVFCNCRHGPVLFVTAAQEFLLGQKLVLHVKLPTE